MECEEHDVMLGREIMLFALWIYKAGAVKGANAYIELLRVLII